MDRLQEILQTTRANLDARRSEVDIGTLLRLVECMNPVRSLAASVTRSPGIGVIAEVKRRSPSVGDINMAASPKREARACEIAGACAISVLTEPAYFDGSLDDLREVRAAVDVPLLRKDFLVDEVQVYEARAAGADAILLIVAALDDHLLGWLRECALDIGLEVLVEVHDEDELMRAVGVKPDAIAINNRNLHDFTVDTSTVGRIASLVPPGHVIVAASGIRTGSDARAMADAGAHGVLVGEALMRSDDPGCLVREMMTA